MNQFPWQGRPVRRLGDNAFQCGNRFLVMRREKERVLRQILSQKDAVVLYLVDDNIWSASKDMTLPEQYRKNLAALTSDVLPALSEQVTHFIVSADTLLDKLPAGVQGETLSPCWHSEPPGDSHFDQNTIKLVHLGTNSHLAGLDFLQPVLEQVFESTSSVTFTYYSNTPLLGELDKNELVFRRRIKRWSEYKKRIGLERFHLGLYPIMDTIFNQGRSYSKVLEYSLTGCAGLYSSNWRHSDIIEQGVNGWLCENNQQRWLETILYLVDNPTQLQKSFNGATQLFHKLNNLQQQRKFWLERFIRE